MIKETVILNLLEAFDEKRFWRLKKIFDERVATLNQPIKTYDMLLTVEPPYHKGESTHIQHQAHAKIRDEKTRLFDHIKMLMDIPNKCHKGRHMTESKDGTFILKKDKRNHLTRLLTHEFSFYTKTPFSLDEFRDLISKLSQASNALYENVHILLSSFAVLDDNDTLLNVSLYIMGGLTPQIKMITKNMSWDTDVSYGKALFYQSLHIDKTASSMGVLIDTQSQFEVETAGGACYTQVVEVCLDHDSGHAIKQLNDKLTREDVSASGLHPLQVEHCVSSNSIELQEKYCASDYVTHIDPRISMHLDHRAIGDYTDKRSLFQSIEKPEELYKGVAFFPGSSTHLLVMAPFGASSQTIECLKERPLSAYSPAFQKKVASYNEGIYRQFMIDKFKPSSQRGCELVVASLKELQSRLQKKMAPSKTSRFFEIKESFSKRAFYDLIEKQFSDLFKELAHIDNLPDALDLSVSWHSNMLLALQVEELAQGPSALPFVETLKKTHIDWLNHDIGEALNEKGVLEEVAQRP